MDGRTFGRPVKPEHRTTRDDIGAMLEWYDEPHIKCSTCGAADDDGTRWEIDNDGTTEAEQEARK